MLKFQKHYSDKKTKVRGKVKEMENTEYIMSSLDEYFEILDKENKKRSELVAKSLVKYLQKSKENNKFASLQMAKQVKVNYFGKRYKIYMGLKKRYSLPLL